MKCNRYPILISIRIDEKGRVRLKFLFPSTAICFNYQGGDLSRGFLQTQNQMIEDVMPQVERLLDLGVKPENICLDGMCIGGAVATLATAKLHEDQKPVKLNNERSFRSLPRLGFGFIAPDKNNMNWLNPMTYIRYLGAGLVYVITWPLTVLSGWSMDAASAWEKIPEQDKIYSMVRDEQNQQYDEVVHDSISSIGSLVDAKRAHIITTLNFWP